MGQEANDLDQLKKIRQDLANVYKSQVTNGVLDNGNIIEINKAIIGINLAIQSMQARSK